MNPHTVEFVGPFPEHHVLSVDGYLMPNAVVQPCKGGPRDGASLLILDSRFCIEAPDDEIKRWAWIIFNAMAIGAGYSCYGENSTKTNPFQVKLSQIGK